MRVAEAVWVWPESSVQPTVTLSPGWNCCIAVVRLRAEVTVRPSTEVMTSLVARPMDDSFVPKVLAALKP